MAENNWISENSSFYKINNEIYNVKIKWSKSIYNDLINLSQYYFNSAYEICIEIVENTTNNNEKNDMWFLPCVYLFRQSIELLIKANLSKIIKFKPLLQEEFLKAKHNLELLFNTYKSSGGVIGLTNNELIWIEKYLKSIEIIDENSDLFRYPFKDEFLSQYGDSYLDIVNMANKLVQCYSILTKCFSGHIYKDNDIDIDITYIPEFFSFASNGIGNCYLWDTPYGDGFHKQVIGYSKTSEFLFKLYKKSKMIDYIYPTIFLLRNAVELALKRLLHARTEFKIPEHKIKRIKNTHLLYKDLWLNIKEILEHYANDEDIKELCIAEKYILEINSIDKNGDVFRYPFSYSFEYKFDNKLIDVENLYIYFQSIFNFLDGCDSMLSCISDCENEMYSYYGSEIDSYYEDIPF